MHISLSFATAAIGLLFTTCAAAIDVDPTDSQSIIDAASTIAASVMSRYSGNIPGLFPDPYYWWESGLAWDSLINYAALTGDDQYNDAISQAMLWQVGPDYNYMTPNQTRSLGNDDQSFWALAAMTAEETGFPPPEDEAVESWLQLAQAVFDTQVARWDNDSCGGGLRWQIFTFNGGYDWKNSFSNGNFMNLAARLYASTQNETYADWFNKAQSWMSQVGLYDNETGSVFDGTDVTKNCRDINNIQWTASSGMLVSSYAYMVAANSDSVDDATPPMKLLSSVEDTFVKDDVLHEVAWAGGGNCSVDQLAFRAVLARALAVVRDSVDTESNSTINTILQASAVAAGAQCSGGSNDTTCGSDWTKRSFDGSTGLSEDLSALNIMLANLPQQLSSSNLTSASASGSGSGSSGASHTSSGGAAEPTGNGSVPAQGENGGTSHAASTLGLLSPLSFVVAFFL